jgi:hypothetical protein
MTGVVRSHLAFAVNALIDRSGGSFSWRGVSAAGDRREEGNFVAVADLHIAIPHFLVDRNQNPGRPIKGAVEWLATCAQQRHQLGDRLAIDGEFKLFRLQPESFRKTRKIENFRHRLVRPVEKLDADFITGFDAGIVVGQHDQAVGAAHRG